MLRQIVLLSLAMTAYATLIPTKVNAANFTLTAPDNKESEVVPSTSGSKPSFPRLRIAQPIFPPQDPFPNLIPEDPFKPPFPHPPIAQPTFPPLDPPQDPFPDPPEPQYPPGDYPNPTPDPNGSVIVPEPVTIFGTVTALGWGALLKRKFSKKKKS
jgi:hypothetical protein